MNDTDRLEYLRNEYRSMQRRGIAAIQALNGNEMEQPNRAFNGLVFDRLFAEDLEPTPENWIRQARVLVGIVEAQLENYEEHLFNERDQQVDNDQHMGYDTLEERNMDREWN